MAILGLEPGYYWLVGGVLLLILELVAPGVFLAFVGMAAIATGAITLAIGLGLPMQLVLFALYTLVAILIGKRFYAQPDAPDADPLLNDRAARLLGRTVTAVTAIDEEGGRVRVGDGEWGARGGPASAGEKVVIIGVEGNCLRVERAPALPAS